MFLLLVACSGTGQSPFGDTDSGDSADTDTDSGGASWCDDTQDTSPPGGPDCFSGAPACGSTIEATTEGGVASLATDDYGHNFCITDLASQGYTGAERVYLVELEGGVYAVATVSTCAHMAVSAMRWTEDGTCPEAGTTVSSCEGDEGEGTLAVTFGGYPDANRWAVVVDTAAAEPAAFRLTLECG